MDQVQRKENTRAFGYCGTSINENFALIFGAMPTRIVKAETKMVQDIATTFENNINKDNLTLPLPHIFGEVNSKDAKIELVTSNNLCPINLVYSHNNVTNSIACIFVNSECNGVSYTDHDLKASKAEELFKDILEFNTVTVHNNLSKAEIIRELA